MMIIYRVDDAVDPNKPVLIGHFTTKAMAQAAGEDYARRMCPREATAEATLIWLPNSLRGHDDLYAFSGELPNGAILGICVSAVVVHDKRAAQVPAQSGASR